MNWIQLTSQQQLADIKSATGYSVIFKHSTRCSVSMMAKRTFERDGDIIPQDATLYFLDLIAYRDLSNQVAEMFEVQHQSPQILLIKNGKCILESSHSDISADEIAETMAA
ncbi:bacillithiol system protein YtxJ [Pedobacter sp. UYP30]|uniref:bacillithiol system redox-active protein YtxJ n=1 Tax=Pedobacter sp. UYP30 TaxID=1756400 RepID=UPI003392B901